MRGFRSSLAQPPPDGEPLETFRWVRRWEIVAGIANLAFGLAFWNHGWWSWLFIGIGLFSLLPWPGAGALVRKAERDPSAFVSDPETRERRGRRAAFILVPMYTAGGVAVGYVAGGWPAAIFVGLLVGFSASFGAWRSARRYRSPESGG